jgi:predicted MPP superfamily phosphohydrolase
MSQSVKDFLKNAEWHRQHGWRRAIWQTMSHVGLTGLHALPLNRRWVDIQRRPMPFPNLDPAFVGYRIVQISYLHFSPVVWQRYLAQYVRWVNDLEPDLVVVTGDLITGGYRYAKRIATILSKFNAPDGCICTFGNHDYSVFGKTHPHEAVRRGDYLEKSLEARGLNVLRNEHAVIQRKDAKVPLTIVGLDDEWSGQIDPETAWKGVDASGPILCLNHNPANVMELMPYPWQWMLSGHTHGRQVATSRVGRTLYAKRFRQYTHGYYAIHGRHLYVNRGLSYGQRVHNWCRPEVSVFRLEQG